MMRLCLLCLVFGSLGSCSEPETPPKQRASDNITLSESREGLVTANRHLAQKENDLMDAYARSHQIPFVKTNSGIRYFVYRPSEKGDSVRTGMTIAMDYTVTLLDGTPAYSSAQDGPKTFEVGHDDIESGIQRGVTCLKKGDKALLLIPSALAHGLVGDMRKIPPQMPIVYDVHILQ
jgi:FKBP-type peptidyl-prolyl cis-trans isomerase FkpA